MGQPTMDDVASRAGVSRALVSLVMRNSPRVSDSSRTAVLAAADQLGYRPNLMARNLASRRTMTIGVLLDDLHNPFYADVADGIMAAAATAGYQVLLTTGMNHPMMQQRAVETLLQLHTDGAILVSPRIPLSEVERAARTMPMVAVAEPLETEVFDTVSNDEDLGADLVVAHLVELGHADIVHTDGGQGAGSRRRREAYLRAMERHGLAERARVVPAEFTEQGGYAAAEALLGAPVRPTAVFAANDLSAAGVMDCCDDAGLRIPDDLSVVGYDNTALAAMRLVSLTTVDQPRAEMGALAFTTLMERIDGGRVRAVHHILPPKLVVRRSTR